MLVVLIISGVVLLSVLVIGIIMIINSNKETLEEQRTSYLEELGDLFYSRYFDHISSGSTQAEANAELAKFTETGMQVNLDSLSNIDTTRTEKINELFENCNRGRTGVRIFPKEPFGAKDFTLNVNLDCEEE